MSKSSDDFNDTKGFQTYVSLYIWGYSNESPFDLKCINESLSAK